MTGTELSLIIGGAGATITAIGTLLYVTPGKAWRMLVESLNERVTLLEQERTENRIELRAAEVEVRRLRTIRSVLEDLLRRAGIEVPQFVSGEHPDVAPERRSSVVAD